MRIQIWVQSLLVQSKGPESLRQVITNELAFFTLAKKASFAILHLFRAWGPWLRRFGQGFGYFSSN